MSFIALDICGGRFAKGCRIKGMILHALSGDASYLPISNIIAAERWGSSRNGVTHEYVQFRSAPVLRGFPAFCASLFRIDLFLDFITRPFLQEGGTPGVTGAGRDVSSINCGMPMRDRRTPVIPVLTPIAAWRSVSRGLRAA